MNLGHHRIFQQRTQIAQISADANSRWSPGGLRNLRNLRNLSNLRRLLELPRCAAPLLGKLEIPRLAAARSG
jgi:hypothetical protein